MTTTATTSAEPSSPVAAAATTTRATTKKRKLSETEDDEKEAAAENHRPEPAETETEKKASSSSSSSPAAGDLLPPAAYMARVDRFRTTTELVRERNAVCQEFTKTFATDLVGLLGRSVKKMGSAEHTKEVKTVTDAVDRAKKYQPLLLIENFHEFLAQPFADRFREKDFDYFLDHEVFARESDRVLKLHFARADDAGGLGEEELRAVVNKVFGVMIDVIVFLKKENASAWTQIQDQLAKMFDLSVKYVYLRAQIATDT